MDTNTRKNFMGAAGAGGAQAGQVMLQGYYDSDPDDQVEMSWTVPAGVTSICAVAIGAGEVGERSNSDADGGNGGDLRYVNDIPVTPGETLTLGAGKGFMGDATELDSGHSNTGYGSYLKRGSTSLVYAQGGNGSGTNVGTGGDGRTGKDGTTTKGGGGGGAGRYDNGSGTNGVTKSWVGYGGYGIGLTGNADDNFEGGAQSETGSANWRGCYGGGGGGMDSLSASHISNGAPGGVRVIWGEDRSFPATAGGVFPTAPAGTELEIQFHPPVPYNHNSEASSYRNDIYHLQIIDDTGTNLVASTGNGNGGYNGLAYYSYDGDTDDDAAVGRLADTDRTTYFSDITAPGFGYNAAWSSPTNPYILKFLFDTTYDGTQGQGYGMDYVEDSGDNKTLFGNGAERTDTDEYLTGANHNDNSFTNQFLFKFDSPKVIKKIHWYTAKNHSNSDKGWIPRCRILLDGNVIADDAAHFIEIDTDEGHSANHTSRRLAVFEFT